MNIKNLEYKTITPEYAKSLLDKNFEKNRSIRRQTVLQYARDMKNGNWVSNSTGNQIAPICISKTGKLLDGQHRLNAVIEAGVPVKMYVQYGLDEKAYELMDNGVKRSASDVIAADKNSNITAALIKMSFATKYGKSPLPSTIQGKLSGSGSNKTQVSVTRQDIVRESASDECNVYGQCAEKGAAIYKSITKGSASAYAYCIWLCKWLGRDESLDNFIKELSSTKPATNGNVELVKRTILTRYAGGKHTKPLDLISIVLRGYEASRNNISLERINKLNETINLYGSLIESKRETVNGDKQEDQTVYGND